MNPTLRFFLLLFVVCMLLPRSVAARTCEDDPSCVDQGNWQLGVAIGLGARSNPLVDGDTIPLIILPDIAWYGENAYFDNGELGYQWANEADWSLETFVSFERERAFFSFWHPGNVLVFYEGFSPDIASELGGVEVPPPVSIDEVAERRWALNGGLRLHWLTTSGEWSLSLHSDISSVHNGQKAVLAYQYNWRIDDWHLSVRPSLSWKSRKLMNYYYGIGPRDGLSTTRYYQASGGLQPALSFAAYRPINPDWQWIIKGSYQRLHSGMYDSPLVEEKDVRSLFFGIGYRF